MTSPAKHAMVSAKSARGRPASGGGGSAPGGKRRHQRYIKRSFQRRFIIQFCLLMVLGCLAFGAGLYLYATRTLTTAFIDSKLRVMSTAQFLLPALAICTLAVAAALALLAAARLLFFSHRIAGPLYRLEKTAQAIGNGDLSAEVRLRRGDELQDFAHSMDGMAADLRALVREVHAQTQRLQEILAQANQHAAMPPELLQQLQDTQGRLNDAISRFRV